MDVQTILAIGGVAFGAGSFLMGALVTRSAISDLRTKMAEDRLAAENSLKEWVEKNFQRVQLRS